MKWLGEQDFGVDLGSLNVASDIVREQDWANNWKKYYKPTRVGQHIVIKPSWEEYAVQPDDRIIEIDPGMAVGTGTHETTSLCLAAVERYATAGCDALDIGCGSGILSIAAVLCGAKHVAAIDIDPVAVRVAKENVELNGVADKVECRVADLLEGAVESADLVLANIVADVILRLMPAAHEHTRPGGHFIASGIIDEREEEIMVSAREQGFAHVETLSRGSWRAIVFRRS
jgi:ribosomal protein L11 methyltransferase